MQWRGIALHRSLPALIPLRHQQPDERGLSGPQTMHVRAACSTARNPPFDRAKTSERSERSEAHNPENT